MVCSAVYLVGGEVAVPADRHVLVRPSYHLHPRLLGDPLAEGRVPETPRTLPAYSSVHSYLKHLMQTYNAQLPRANVNAQLPEAPHADGLQLSHVLRQRHQGEDLGKGPPLEGRCACEREGRCEGVKVNGKAGVQVNEKAGVQGMVSKYLNSG